MFKQPVFKTIFRLRFLKSVLLMLVMLTYLACSEDKIDYQPENSIQTPQVDELQVNQEPQFSARELIYNIEDNVMKLKGEVSFKTNIIEFEDAEEVIWDKNKNEIYVSGMKNFSIDGAIEASGNPSQNIVRHKLNERVAYME